MDSRGPPEGAPAESFEISCIDKGADISVNWPTDHAFASSMCEQPKKLNNRLLFLTVEYVEDQNRLFPAYEHISFSPRPPSPLSEFEHRVSPLDPNMSSAARYSPTPVQLPPSPFPNPVVVLQGPSSPLISQPEPNIRTNINYATQLAHPIDGQTVPQTDTTTDFVGNGNEEGLVSGNELILMQETTPELESSATPLMLTGIPSTDFTLTRDFLVMQDDQINVINTFKNQNIEMEDNPVNMLSVTEDTNKENNNLVMAEYDKEDQQQDGKTSPSDEKKKVVEKKEVRKSKRRLTDKNDLWCDEYDGNGAKDDGNLNDVCTIADQPVPSRAVATLPGSYLSLNKLSTSNDDVIFGVFAKRNIRRRTQFGPIEGVLCPYDGSSFENALPLLYETESGEFLKVDVSNENTSNWMRFVRPALTYKEQNLIICQQKDGIVFLTNRNISAKEELKAGPGPNYANRRNLPILKPDAKDEKEVANQISSWSRFDGNSYNRRINMLRGRNIKEKENSQKNKCGKEWKCSVCNLIFKKLSLLNLHAIAHSSNNTKIENQTSTCPQCRVTFEKPSELVSHVSQHGRSASTKTKTKLTSLSSYKCSLCYKRFATPMRLQQHCLVHSPEDQKPLPCNICMKRFMNNSALTGHLKTHRGNEQAFECPMCKQVFRQGIMLKNHVETHRNQEGIFSCPHCQRTFIKYSVIRKHIRAYHSERKHKCQHCAKCFPTVDKLRMHLLKHSDHREFHCADCGKQFKRKDKLKEHMTKLHQSKTVNGEQMTQTKKFVPQVNPNDYNRFIYKCHQCLVGFKRRGMLVNHLAKRHPEVAPESVPELNLPILRQTRDYYCQYCDKVYKSSSKRKAHIMKNHPGAALPASNRQKESEFLGLPNPTFSQTVGSITTVPHGCQWCHKQYASKAKLLQHQRKKHAHLMEPKDQIPRSRNRPPQNQNQPPALNVKNLVVSDYMPGCDVNGDFLKQKVIKISDDVDLVPNGGLEMMVGQQFVRMRDIR